MKDPITGDRYVFDLVTPDGTVLSVAGQRWILEGHLDDGTYNDTDENDNLVTLPVPPGTQIVLRKV